MFAKNSSNDFGIKICNAPEDGSVDIVFVHGLTGNRERTWKHANGTFWPADLLHEDIPKARILTYGYDADVAHFWSSASQNRISNHALNLLNALVQLRERTETADRDVIFVAHSLGGLVVEDCILASKNSAEPHLQSFRGCVIGIAFLGTPHCGSDMAHWARIFGSILDIVHKTNHKTLEILKPDSEVLARIQKEFHTMLRVSGQRTISICCFYEELPVKGAGEIVPKHSAILPAYNAIGIRDNHMDITKFGGREDPGYQAVSTELWRWAKASEKRSTKDDEFSASRSMPNVDQPAVEPNLHQRPTDTNDDRMKDTSPTQAPSPGDLNKTAVISQAPGVSQNGNQITRNHAGGKAVQGNNIQAQGNVTLNF